jgi:transposase-like protein
MASLQINLPDEKIQTLLHSDRALQRILESALNQLLEAELTEHLQAEPGERTAHRRGYRNGSYERKLTTRVGTLTLDVPRDRDGRFRTELFERYQRSEKALVLSLMEMVVQGVSTRKVKKITAELCGRQFSKSTVSKLSEGLDEQVAAWAQRPLGETSYPFLVADAVHVKVRREGAVRSTAVLIAIGITESGHREILGLQACYGETRASWSDFFGKLRSRGLRGVEYAFSDAHEGLKTALQETFAGVIWGRCQAHFMRNVLDRTPKRHRDTMHAHLKAILYAASPEEARAAFERAAEEIEGKADRALQTLEEGFEDATAVLTLPEKYRRRLRTTNMLERLIEEVRRREKVIRIFPTMQSVWRMVGALLAEQHERWAYGRRYLMMDDYFADREERQMPLMPAEAA